MKEIQNVLVKKILEMKPSQAIQMIIDVNHKPVVKLEQNSFGKVKEGVCYGCTATNMLLSMCELKGVLEISEALRIRDRHHNTIGHRYIGYVNGLGVEDSFTVYLFESAIDNLRQGFLNSFITGYPYFKHHNMKLTVDYLYRIASNSISGNGNEWEISQMPLPYITNESPLNAEGIGQLNNLKTLLGQANL